MTDARRLRLRSTVAALAAALSTLVASMADAAPHKLRGGLPLAFTARPAGDGSGRVLGARERASVTVRFAAPPTAQQLDELVAHGAVLDRRRDGSARRGLRFVVADVDASAAAAIAAMPFVEAVSLDGSVFGAPPPLDYTAALIGAPDTWATTQGDGTPLTGRGMLVCDVDSGIDLFHPLFFVADGGWFSWIDVDGDGAFTPDVDGVDLDGDGEPEALHVLDGLYKDRSGTVLDGSDDPSLRVGWDWLYVDANGNGARDYGPGAGFVESDPAYGEPLFVIDDVDGDGRLDPGERIVRLASSKIRVAKKGKETFRRGENLVELPVEDQTAGHGTGAMSVLAGGQRGLGRFVGIAPEAELVVVFQDDFQNPTALTDFCVEEGARVVLHEYAPWVGFHLDGSSDLEQLIDETSQKNVAHINPVGNLSGADKESKRLVPAGGTLVVPVEAPADFPKGPFHLFAASVLWRDTSRDLAFTVEDPTGFALPLELDGAFMYVPWHDGLSIYAAREDSSRGTARVDVYVFGDQNAPPPIPSGTWHLTVTDSAPPGATDVPILAAVMDDLSRWSKGIHFPEEPTEEHLIDFPATADHAIGVAAYTGHGVWGGMPGDRALYSGRGRRLDGAQQLCVAAPDDPIAAGFEPGVPARYANFGGTSGASPHVAGAAVLLMQADPTRSGDDVRDALRAGAAVDGFVGTVPNDDWGYGKLRVYESIYGEAPPGGGPPTIVAAEQTIERGKAAELAVELADPDEGADGLHVDLDVDYDGAYDASFVGPHVTATFDEVGDHVARLRVRDATGKEAGALALVHVVEPGKPPPAPSAAPEARAAAVEARGGACATGAARTSDGGPLAFLAALALAARRMQRRARRG